MLKILFLLFLPSLLFSQMQATKTFIGTTPVIIYKPATFNPANIYPVIFFLHGSGEMGDGSSKGLDILLNSGNQANLLTNADKYGYIVIAPQLVQSLNGWRPEFSPSYVHPVINYVIATLPVDTSRMIITGLSLGGGGTWQEITGPDAGRFAAAIPICGTPQAGLDYSSIAKYHIPVWAFHALDDATINVAATQNTVNSIDAFSPVPLPMVTYYKTGGHGVWGTAYATDSLYTWINIQRKSGAVVTIPVPPTKTELGRIFVTALGKFIVVYSDGSTAQQ
jgi:predicted peptidase